MTVIKTILGLLLAGLVIGVIVATIQVVYVIGVVLLVGAVTFCVAAIFVDSIQTWWRSRG